MYPWKTVFKRPSFWGFLLFLALIGLWLAHPDLVGDAARDGLGRCGMVLIPSLFPFFVLSNLFVRRGYHHYVAAALRPVMRPLFGLNGAAAGALALGAVGGYPIGAATAFSLYDRGELSREQTSRLLAFCNNAGPGFIFGVIGAGVLGSVRAGALLCAVHLISAAMVGAAMRAICGSASGVVRRASTSLHGSNSESFAVSFVGAIRDAAFTMVQVCAFLVFFSVLLAFLRSTPLWQGAHQILQGILEPEAAASLLDGAIELSTGVSRISSAGGFEKVVLICSAFELGWGGLCVHMQVLSLRDSRDVPMRFYWAGKFLQGVLSAFWMVLLLYFQGIFLVVFPLCCILTVALPLRKKTSTGKLRAYRV